MVVNSPLIGPYFLGGGGIGGVPLDFHDIYLYTNRLREPVDSPTKQKHSHEVGTTAVWPSSPSVTS